MYNENEYICNYLPIFYLLDLKGKLGKGLINVVHALQAKMKRNCVVIANQLALTPEVYAELQVVSLTNPDENLERWMREDRHGTKFDTGCTVIVTKAANIDKEIERKFKNLMWIVLDKLPNQKALSVEWPLVKLYPNIVLSYCPFVKVPKVSSYEQ